MKCREFKYVCAIHDHRKFAKVLVIIKIRHYEDAL